MLLFYCLAGWYLLQRLHSPFFGIVGFGIGWLIWYWLADRCWLVCWYLLVGIFCLVFGGFLLCSFLADKFFHLGPLLVLDQVPLLQLVSVLQQLIWHPVLQLLKEVLNDRFRIVKSPMNCLVLTATSFFSACDWIVAARYFNYNKKVVSPSIEHFQPKLKFHLKRWLWNARRPFSYEVAATLVDLHR